MNLGNCYRNTILDLRFEILDLKNWRIEESELTDESGELLSDTMFLISA